MTTQQTPLTQPAWQRILTSQQFLGLLTKAIAGSGFLTVPLIQKWFPDVTPTSLSGIMVEGIPFVVAAGVGWYRDHPDNVLARAVQVINGGSASPQAVAAAAVAVQKAT